MTTHNPLAFPLEWDDAHEYEGEWIYPGITHYGPIWASAFGYIID